MTDRFQPDDHQGPNEPADDLFGPLDDDELTDDALRALTDLLDEPRLWAEPSPGVEDAVLAALGIDATADAAAGPSLVPPTGATVHRVPDPGPTSLSTPLSTSQSTSLSGSTSPVDPASSPTPATADGNGDGNVVSLDRARRLRRWMPVTAAAALLVAALAAISVVRAPGEPDADVPVAEVALAGTEEMPGASARVEVIERPNGALIRFEATDLEPAPEGMFYAAWLIRPEPRSRISAGTFHMRGGDGSIGLWTGVWDPSYTLFTVTLQRQDDPEAPGPVVLRGEFG